MSRPIQAAAKARAARRVLPKRDPQKQLRLYGRPIRRVVQALASRHPRLADLAFSHPGLLAALASPRLGFKPAQAIAAVIAGKPLAEVAALAGVPMWLRKLPPQAFTGCVPPLPDGEMFRRRIGNHLPKASQARLWLHHVARAHSASHEPFALWIARQPDHAIKQFKWVPIEFLGLWAWYSLQPDEGAGRFLSKRWSPDMELAVARKHASAWSVAVRSHCIASACEAQAAWLTPGNFEGLEFVPILTTADLCNEAEVMDHCAATYCEDVAEGRRQFWSVRKDGKRAATLSLSLEAGDSLVHINEVRGHSNADVPQDVAFAARRWLNSHEVETLRRQLQGYSEVKRAGEARKLWRSYWLKKRRFPWWLPANGELDH